MSERIECPGCGKDLAPTTSGRYRKHGGGDCDFSGAVIQEDVCESTPDQTATTTSARSAESSQDDAAESATSATPSTDSSPDSPGPAGDASTASVPRVLPGVEEYLTALAVIQEELTASYRERVDAGLTFSPPLPYVHEADQPPLFSQPEAVPDGTTDSPPPASPFSQPAGRKSEQPEVEMSRDGAEIAARLKELFYSYDNRRSSDNRSAQATMGPSEMGTPCDRRLALSLMRMPPVNPGGDGWAAFVGTCIHAGLEQMLMWADADTGRFAVEQRLEFGSVYVPKGTADLIDRTLLMILDHKCQGRWSRNKLKTQGPSQTYRVQAHVYAYGARLRGEKIEKIAIVSWPRDEATLDDLYVHVEDYNPMIAKKAFERVEEIGASVESNQDEMRRIRPDAGELEVKALVAANYQVADDCRFCPFFLPNARDITRGCNGRR